jgi:hypothetical protein
VFGVCLQVIRRRGAWLAAVGGQWRVAGPDLQVSGVHGDFLGAACGVRPDGRCRGEDRAEGEGGLDDGGPELGEGGQAVCRLAGRPCGAWHR